MKQPKMYKWTVEFQVSENWIADQFNLTQERAQEMIEGLLPYANDGEVVAIVKKSPSVASMQKAEVTE